jgi:hypothetical protein
MKVLMRKIFAANLYAVATSIVAALSFGIVTFLTFLLRPDGSSADTILYMSVIVFGVSFVSCFFSYFLSHFSVFTPLWVNLCAAICSTLVPVSWGLISQSPLILAVIAISAIPSIYFGIKIFIKVTKHLDFLNSQDAAD